MVETLSLKRLSSDGAAVGQLADGRTAFIASGCPGDVVEAMIDSEKPRFVRGHVARVIEPGPQRVDPRCSYFGWGKCGSCQWQHIGEDAAREAKRGVIVDALVRIGKLADVDALTRPVLASPQSWGYRNKIELEARLVRGRLELGFHRAGSSELVCPDACPLFAAPFADLLKSLQGALRYSLGSVDYRLSRVALRYSDRSSAFEIACVTEPGPFPRARVASTLKTACPSLTSIVRVLQKTPPAGSGRRRPTPQLKGVEVLAGAGCWEERLAGFSYKVSAPSFFQVNTAAAELLVGLAREALAADGSDHVADLYCGVGTFSLPLAADGGTLSAVESCGPALRDLRRNLDGAGLSAEVIGGEVGRDTSALGSVDGIVVDPPRAGLSHGARAEILRLAPARLAYVSCDPATLARDLAALVAAGYSLRWLQPVDLFPHTPHVECVASLSKEPV